MHKRMKPYIEMLKKLGFEVDRIEPTGKTHYKVYVRVAGLERWVLIPNSPSDHRAFLNFKSQARKVFNEMVETS